MGVLTQREPVGADRARSLVAIHAEHGDFVWRSLQRLGVRDADLDDMLQEVFIVVHRKLDSFDHSSRIRTWLFGICLRVAAGYRRSARFRREELSDRLPETRDAAANPEERAHHQQRIARLGRILDGLSLEQRAVFVMFELEGLSCVQIAGTMGCPVGTVYSRLDAARERFQKLLRLEVRREGGAP